MKKLSNYLLLFLFTFSAPSFADDARDFQIEGIRIGDSLLDHYSQIEINNGMFGGNYSDDYFMDIGLPTKNEDFDNLGFFYKKNDNKYIIHFISGDKKFIDDLESCFAFMDEVESTVDQMLMNTKKKEYEYVYKNLADGKSVSYISEYPLENGQIRVYCQDWSEETKKQFPWEIQGSVEVSTKEVLKWLTDYN